MNSKGVIYGKMMSSCGFHWTDIVFYFLRYTFLFIWQLVVARFKHNLKKYLEMRLRRATEVATVKEPEHIPAETEEDGEKPTSDPSTEGSASDN